MSTQAPATKRRHRLKAALESRRAQLIDELHHRVREARAEGVADRDGIDEAEHAEVGMQDDIGFALIQLKAETLEKVDNALRRIEGGTYGTCLNCGCEISEARLRALPFALRCIDCEEAREGAVLRERSLAQHSPTGVPFASS